MEGIINRIILGAFLIFIISCNAAKQVPLVEKELDTRGCQFEAVMLDYTSNSYCQYLFRLTDGKVLLPSAMPQVNFPFYNNKKVILGYQSYESKSLVTKSDCGLEDEIVQITCIQEAVEEITGPKTYEACKSVKNVSTSAWMPEIIALVEPQKIFEYEYTIGYLYLFKKDETSYLYDCLGNKLCDSNDAGDCNSLIESLGKATLIQVLKN